MFKARFYRCMFKVGDCLVSVVEGKFCCGGEILLRRGILSWKQFLFYAYIGKNHTARKLACAYALTGIALWGNSGKLSLNKDLLKIIKGTLSL